MNTLNCPNCGATYNPAKYMCEYCGSFIILTEGNYVDLSNENFEVKKVTEDKYPGIYVFGRLLGRGEKPIVLGAANYFTGILSAGGKLLLTNKSVSFSAHGINVGKKEVVIKLDDITNVRVSKNFLISQHITISTSDNTHKFVVYHGHDWVEKIKYSMANPEMEIEDAVESFVDSSSEDNFDYTLELRKLKNLFDEGIITEEEFNIKKRAILKI